MDSNGEVLCITGPKEDRISMILSLVSSALSMVGSLTTIFYFSILLGKKRSDGNNNTLNKLILILGICDFLGALFICVQDSQLLLWSSAYSRTRCSIFRMAIQFFYTSTFFWTSFIAIVIFKETKDYKVSEGK